MAESNVAVTPGSGKNMHTFNLTIGAVSVEDEVFRQADQYLASYVVDTAAAVSVATANDHIMQIMAGSTLNVYIRRIRIWQLGLATTAAYGQVQILRLTTAGTGGTAQGVDKLDETDAAAGATAMTLPTVKGTEGTRLYNWSHAYTQTVSATPAISPLLVDLDFDSMPRVKPIRIAAGTTNGICIKHITAIAAATVLTDVELTEANF